MQRKNRIKDYNFCEVWQVEENEQKTIPENEYKEHQQHGECGHIVHGLYQNHELPPQGRKEADQLQNPQQAEGSQHWQASLRLTRNLPHAGDKHMMSTKLHSHSISRSQGISTDLTSAILSQHVWKPHI